MRKEKTEGYIKPTQDKKQDIILAFFWKYGYWMMLLIILMLFGNDDNHMVILGFGAICFGIYSIIISIKPSRHFVIGMLEGSSQKSDTYTHGWKSIKKCQRDTRLGGMFFICLGIVALIIT